MTDFETKLLEIEEKKLKALRNIAEDTIRIKETLHEINDTLEEELHGIGEQTAAIDKTLYDTLGSAETGDALRNLAKLDTIGSYDYTEELQGIKESIDNFIEVRKEIHSMSISKK